MGTTFKFWQCHDASPVLSQEMSIQRVLAFAGIHDTSALSAIDDDMDDTSGLDNTTGTWTSSSGKLHGAAGATYDWYLCNFTTEIEPGFVATFDKYDDVGGFLVQSNDSLNGYLIWWTASAVGVSKILSNVETKYISLPRTETGTAHVTVAAWPLRYAGVDTIDDVAFGLWFDGKLLLTHIIPYSAFGKKVGFAVPKSGTADYDNLRIAQFHQIVEWTSIDPGEQVSQGLSRVLGLDKIKLLARYDGSVKIWRNSETEVDWTMPKRRPLQVMKTYDLWAPTHMRFVGAVREADIFRAGNMGHVYVTGNDPNALDPADTYLRGQRKMAEMVESSSIAEVVVAPHPPIEPEDVISWDGTSYRVTSIAYRVGWNGDRKSGAPVLQSTMTLRGCLDEYDETE